MNKQTLVEWSLDGPLPQLCPVILTSNQDGHHAKNRKKGDEILIVHCCFSVSQNELNWFLRRRLKCEMLTDGRRTKGDDNSSLGLKAR
jgi:hypothetical protein